MGGMVTDVFSIVKHLEVNRVLHCVKDCGLGTAKEPRVLEEWRVIGHGSCGRADEARLNNERRAIQPRQTEETEEPQMSLLWPTMPHGLIGG